MAKLLLALNTTPAPVGLTLQAAVKRWDGGSGSLAMSNGVPFAEGDVTEEIIDDREIRVFVDGVEQSVYTEALDGRWPDGSVKFVLIQFACTFAGTETAEIQIGVERETTDLTIQSLQPNPDGFLYPTDPEYLCDSFPLWFNIIPQSEHPTSPDSFGVELDSIHAKYLDIYDDIWTAKAGYATGEQCTLATRTDNTSGVLSAFQGLAYDGNTVNIYWNSGANSRLGVTIGTVTGRPNNAIAPFSGGTGDNLPAEGTSTIFLKSTGTDFFAVYTGAAYDWNRHSYGRFCMTGDSDFLKETVEHGWDLTDGYGRGNGYALPEQYASLQQSMLLHYWLTGNDDSRTAAYQYIDGSIYDPTDWSNVRGDGSYLDGRLLGVHLHALVSLMHLGQGTIPSMGGSGGTWPSNAAKCRGLIDAWISQQQVTGARFSVNATNAACTLSGRTGTFANNEYLTVNGGGPNQCQMGVGSGDNWDIGRNSGGVMVVPTNTILGQTSGATATIATVGTLRHGTQPWMNMFAGAAMIAYDRFVSSDRRAEILACLKKDYEWMDQFWISGTNSWSIYDTEANRHIVPTGGSPDLNGFVLACLEWMVEHEPDESLRNAWIAKGDLAVKGIDDNGFWGVTGKKQFSEMNWGIWPWVPRRAAE